MQALDVICILSLNECVVKNEYTEFKENHLLLLYTRGVEGGVSESLHEVCKNTAGEKRHFTSQKTLLELRATVKETSPPLIEMDFQEYSSAEGLFSEGDAYSDKTARSDDTSQLQQ